jgi:hypothetical protein
MIGKLSLTVQRRSDSAPVEAYRDHGQWVCLEDPEWLAILNLIPQPEEYHPDPEMDLVAVAAKIFAGKITDNRPKPRRPAPRDVLH